MKKLKNILPLFLMGLLVSMAMTSCLSNDDDTSELTDEQKKSCMMTMSGSYRGNIYFYDKTKDELKNKNYNDSIQGVSVRFSYPESAFVVYDFPAKLLFKQLDKHEDLKEAVESETCDLKIKYTPYQINGTVIWYYMQPETVSMQLNYGGLNHDIKVAFMMNSMGVYSKDTHDLQFVEGAIYDGYDSNGQPELLDGKALYNTSMTDVETKDILFEFYGDK